MRWPSAKVSLQPTAAVQFPGRVVDGELEPAHVGADVPGAGGALLRFGAQLAARRRVGRVGRVGRAGGGELGPREAVLGW